MNLRKTPYPYRAMLAICSDLDETPDSRTYFEIMRYLNTEQDTVIGSGVGLETGNTIYFNMPSDQFSYWNTDDAGREKVRALIRSGHIDCLHSFGDLATTRNHAGRALDELSRHGCRMEVWVDHAIAPTNFGGDIMAGSGDLPGTEAYHADLSCDFGIRYIWRGRITSVTGQETKRRLAGIFHPSRPISSARTLAKEFAKGILGRSEGQKYEMHPVNRISHPAILRDGRPITEFLRMNPFPGGVNLSATADGIAEVLTVEMLDRLVERQGISVLYTHLGKITGHGQPFGEHTRAAFSLLAKYQREGKVLVTTTRRLLGYCALTSRIRTENGGGNGDPCELRTEFCPTGSPQEDPDGLTVYLNEGNEPRRITLNGAEVRGLVRNPPDHTGQSSISIPWSRRSFPDISK